MDNIGRLRFGIRFINVASLSGIATTFMEKYLSFWSAYLLCFCFLWVSAVMMLVFKSHYGTFSCLLYSALTWLLT